MGEGWVVVAFPDHAQVPERTNTLTAATSQQAGKSHCLSHQGRGGMYHASAFSRTFRITLTKVSASSGWV